MYIYLIEMVLSDEVVTSHIFLTKANAYRKFIEFIGLYYDSDDITKIFLIEREINDETGQFTDKMIDKMDSLKTEDRDIDQNVNLHD